MNDFARDGTLSTRNSGKDALAALQRAIVAQPPNAPIVLSFTGVQDITAAFADECIARLLSGRAAGFYEDHPVLAVDANSDVREGLSSALRNRGLVLLSLSGDGPELLGAPEHLDETMRVAHELGEFSVVDLAKRLELTTPAANNRVKQLLRAGALSRARVIPRRGGNEYRYTAPSG